MKNRILIFALLCLTIMTIRDAARAEIKFPDGSTQNTAPTPCVAAGTGSWTTPSNISATQDGAGSSIQSLGATVDCPGNTHWVQVLPVPMNNTMVYELHYFTDFGTDELIDSTVYDNNAGEGTRLASPCISAFRNGNLAITYRVHHTNENGSFTTIRESRNLTPVF